jgi:hypothetical protein
MLLAARSNAKRVTQNLAESSQTVNPNVALMQLLRVTLYAPNLLTSDANPCQRSIQVALLEV